MKCIRKLLAWMLCLLLVFAPLDFSAAEDELLSDLQIMEILDDAYLLSENESAGETASVPEPEATAEPSAEPSADPQAAASANANEFKGADEGEAGTAGDPTAAPDAKPGEALSPDASPDALPSPDPTVEPTPEPSAEPTAQPTIEPSPEPEETPAPVMQIETNSLLIGCGEKYPLAVRFSDGLQHGLSYKSSSKRALVSEDGVISGKTRGSATISVLSEFGEEIQINVKVEYGPARLSLSADRTELGAGESVRLKAKSNRNYSALPAFSSSDCDILHVDAQGNVYAAAPGTAEITAKAYNGKTAKLRFTVKPAPQAVTLSDAEILLGLGEGKTLAAAVNEGSAGAISYISENDEVAVFNAETGRVEAVGLGETVIWAESYNGAKASVKVTVLPAPSCIRISETELTVGVGEKVPMPDVFLGQEGEVCAGSYTVKSAKSKYVSVGDGVITGKYRGKSVVITAECYNGQKASLTVHVRQKPTSVSLNKKELALGVGENFGLKATLSKGSAGTIVYSSSNDAVAVVDAGGNVSAIAVGEAVITASTYNGKKASCAVSIKNAPEDMTLNMYACTLGVGETAKLAAVLNEGSAGSCDFISADPGVAAVDAEGMITGVAPGETRIEVRSYNAVSRECILQVCPAPEGVCFQEENLVLSVGDGYQLQPPVLSGRDAACSSFTYKSSRAKYAAVSQDGWINCLRAGTVNITVETYNKASASIKLTVKAKPKSISFAEETGRVFVGEAYTPKVNFSNGASGSYRLESADESIARVSENGKSLIGAAPGTVEITAHSFNGKTAVMQLNVPALPESVQLQPESIVLGAGDTLQTQVWMPENSGSALRYESSDESVAVVSENGQIRAVGAGEARIHVRAVNDVGSTANLRVLEAPSRLQILPRSAALGLDEGGIQLQIRFGSDAQGGRVRFSSGNETIASVSQDGYVSFHAVGEVRIYAQSYNGHAAVCDLRIGQTPGAMYFEQDEYCIALGDTIRIPASFDGGCESYGFTVENAGIASAQGDRVTGLAMGSTVITAVSASGLSASCTVHVVAAPGGIELEETSAEMILHSPPTLQLHAKTLPDNIGSVYYLSSNTDVACVDYVTGEVTTTGVGECVITAVTYDGLHSAECSLTVHNLLHGVKIGIDPGHQLKQDKTREQVHPDKKGSKARVSSGTSGRYTKVPEYVVTLQVGLRLRDLLESYGAEVYMTREVHDINISNQERAKMMNALGVDMVLRLHCNGSSSSRTNGMCSYVRQTGPGKQESADISALVLKHMSQLTGTKNNGINYSDKYTGLNWSEVPSLLLEMGYMSNPVDDRNLVNAEHQKKLAMGMVNGICEYLNRAVPYA